jgi:hypothetical protein
MGKLTIGIMESWLFGDLTFLFGGVNYVIVVIKSKQIA